MSKTIYRTIDLFAGIGGIRRGFEATGRFKTVYANDFDRYCKQTYDKNFDDTPLDLKDIKKVSVLNGDVPEFDFLLAGFPCQPFSVGAHGKGFEDEKGRGTLIEEVVRLLDEAEQTQKTKPIGFFLENVKNLLTHDNGQTYQIIYEMLTGLGYHIEHRVYNSLDFGVAQSRERIYIVGFKDVKLFDSLTWPEPSGAPYVRVNDIIDDAVDPKYYYDGSYLDSIIGKTVSNPNSVYTYRRNYVREQKKGYAPTLVASMGMGGHNVPIIRDRKGIRRLTPTECARLQGYYHLHKPIGMSDNQIYKQIGNSVTVPVIQAVAQSVIDALEPQPETELIKETAHIKAAYA
jgi:DNA (cytosine-5)-methyltransferase 1